MRGTSNDLLRLSILAALSLTAAAPGLAQQTETKDPAINDAGSQDTAQAQGAITAQAQGAITAQAQGAITAQAQGAATAQAQGAATAQAATTEPGPTPPAAGNEQSSLDTIVVTGSTSKRTLLNASVNVTLATATDLEQRAPRATADVLSLIPGVFVESTAGPVSNNYSVRGLPGGGQSFINLEEDGMPVLYGGGGADEYFQNDITIDHVEAVQGGTSGVLTPNGAGMTVNFFSKPMSFDEPHGEGRLMGATYGEQRADLYYTAPIPLLGNDVAFSVGGYADSTKGVRSSPFTFQTYHFKGAIEKRFGDGGFVKFTYKRWDEHDPYYADMPYRYVNGQIEGIPGLNPQSSNITGPGFANIALPDSCATGNCLRDFSSSNGIHATGNQYRIDLNLPINDSWAVFAKARFLQSNWDFNGVFPGSGSGNSGLATALNYLTPGANSPIDSLLTSGLAAFPGTTQFGIRNLTTGQLIAGSNLAALNALNGNGLLQQTVLNQQYLATRDLGTDFGVKYSLSGDGWSNSLTVGGMYYRVRQYNDQSAVAPVINGVSNSSAIYDVVGLNAAGGITGTLTNNGLVNYGNWGEGIWSNTLNSISGYFNDELALLDNKLHLDFGLRREDVVNVLMSGNTAAVNAPVPAGTTGLARDVGSTFDGTYTRGQFTTIPTSWTVGANYTLISNLAVRGRFFTGNETNGGNNLSKPARVVLSELGLVYGGYGLLASATVFRTNFNDQNYSYIQPNDPAVSGSFQANSTTNGVDVDATYRPTFQVLQDFAINVKATYQKPKLSNVFLGEMINGVTVNSKTAAEYDGNVPGRTFQTLYSVTPSYDLPNHLGQLYLRYEYIGKIYADAGDGLALPGYGTLSVGGNVQVGPNLNLSANVYNVTNVLGLTEGNPRQGQTQSVVNGYFYGRGIVGPNAQVSLTYKF